MCSNTTTAEHSAHWRIKELILSTRLCHRDDRLSFMGVFLRKNQGGLGFLFMLSLHHTSQVSCRDTLFCLSLPAPTTQIPARSQVFNGDFPADCLVVLWLSRVRRSALVVSFLCLCLQHAPFSETMSTFIPVPTESYQK